jgi:hypothetical protein
MRTCLATVAIAYVAGAGTDRVLERLAAIPIFRKPAPAQ